MLSKHGNKFLELITHHLRELCGGDTEDLSELFGGKEGTQTAIDVRHKFCRKDNTEPAKVLRLLCVEGRFL